MEIKMFTVNPFLENTYVLYDDTREAAIVDCGCLSEHEQNELRTFIESNKLIVKHLLNTHLHLDHQFGNYFAAQAFGVLPEAHAADANQIDNIEELCSLFGLTQRVKKQPLGRTIDEHDVIAFGHVRLEILYVPGHSAGSICFYNRADGIVLSGDVLFHGSIGRTDLPGGNFEQLIDGIRCHLLTLPDNTQVFCGHGPATTIGFERINNPYLQ